MGGGGIIGKMRARAADPRFRAGFSSPSMAPELLSELARVAVALYWQTRNFTVLHLVIALAFVDDFAVGVVTVTTMLYVEWGRLGEIGDLYVVPPARKSGPPRLSSMPPRRDAERSAV